MDDIRDVVKRAEETIVNQQERVIPGFIVKLVNDLFTLFYGICRGFLKQYEDTKRLSIEKTQWMIAFMDEGINSMEQINLGVARTRRQSPINTPTIGQFLDWCIPSNQALQVPDLNSAYDEACRNSHPCAEKSWSHKLVQHAWKLTGSYFLANSARSVTYPVFERNYAIAIREWRAGKEISEIKIPLALESPVNVKRSEDISRKAIADCMKMLKG